MKDSTVSARVENSVKIEAEDILQKLGVPVSVVINSLSEAGKTDSLYVSVDTVQEGSSSLKQDIK